MSADDFTDIEIYIDELRTRLGEQGWRIELDIEGSRVRVTFHHDLTTPLTLSLVNGKSSLDDLMLEDFNASEFAIIAKAPPVLEHAPLLKAVREAATSHSWDNEIVVVIALILRSHGVINNDEAKWLENAGHLWGA